MNIFRIKWTAQPELDFRIRTIGNKNNYRESFYILVLYCDLLISYRVEKEDKWKYNSCCKLHTAFEFLVKIPLVHFLLPNLFTLKVNQLSSPNRGIYRSYIASGDEFLIMIMILEQRNIHFQRYKRIGQIIRNDVLLFLSKKNRKFLSISTNLKYIYYKKFQITF